MLSQNLWLSEPPLFALRDAVVVNPWTTILVLVVSILVLYRLLAPRERFWHDELEQLGVPRRSPRLGTAVVCGSSIAGLLTARVCSYHFKRVVLIDPEFTKVKEGKIRSRIIQAQSLHVYLLPFMEALRRLWPSFEQKAKDAGAIRFPGETYLYFEGVIAPIDIKKIEAYPSSINLRRWKLDPLLHQSLAESNEGNIEIIDGLVKELVKSPDGERISSVHGGVVGGEDFKIDDVDLVIDCTGNNQYGVKWLNNAGFTTPPDLRISHDPKVRYVTITFEVAEHIIPMLELPGGYDDASWLCSYHHHGSSGSAALLSLAKMDNDTIQLCCGTWGASNLPREASQIEDFVLSVQGVKPVPDWFLTTIRILAAEGNPTFEFARISDCSFVRYHQMKNIPDNFVAVGDSVMRLNPLFGQGCAKATVGATTLNAMLHERTPEGKLPQAFSRDFFKLLAKRLDSLWVSGKAVDYGYPTTVPHEGETCEHGKHLRTFFGLLQSASEVDDELALGLWATRQLVEPEEIIFAPMFVMRILRGLAIQRFRKMTGRS